ncbi:MAG TPA: YlbF family regulator [Bellilinea sp.]|jgi:cell fate (sporulation/competence/biofilm development) regulator YlbF (YheA/YmcA/DUF963 family)|nr:YlbF family regulator [Bellilinea sp.]
MVIHAKREAAVDKDNEMTSAISAVSVTMLEATSNLAENLTQSEAFLRFKMAEAKLNADQEAQLLLTEFSELQRKIRSQRQSDDISESDIKRLRALQSDIGTNDTIQDYEYKKELAVAFLREVNQEISQLLGIDFASLTRRSGGCC